MNDQPKKKSDDINSLKIKGITLDWGNKDQQEPMTGGPQPPPDLEFFNATDKGNARRFATQHQGKAKHSKSIGWFIWDGKHWANDNTDQVKRLALQTAKTLFDEAEKEEDEKKKVALFRHAYQSEAEKKINSMVSMGSYQPEIITTGAEFDNNPWLFNCQNGTLDLRTGQLRRHNPNDLLTQLSPVAFDPAAKCPLWEKFLYRVMCNSEELTSFLQRAVGYSLTGITKEQKFFLCWGIGRNGKGSFFNTLAWLFGDYSKNSQFKTFEQSNKEANSPRGDLVGLRGKRFAFASESNQGVQLDEATIKLVTGGDPITARQLNKEEITFFPNFKLWLMTNNKPIIKGTDEAIWERVLFVPWNAFIPKEERDEDLLDKLKAEGPGILNWALAGCLAWQEKKLSAPAAVKAATEAYRNESDPLRDFLDAKCDTKNELAKIKGGDLYSEYTRFTMAEGESLLSHKQFTQRLERMGFQKKLSNGLWWIGISLIKQQAKDSNF